MMLEPNGRAIYARHEVIINYERASVLCVPAVLFGHDGCGVLIKGGVLANDAACCRKTRC